MAIYCAKFELYTGVRQQEPSPDGITYDLVMRMMEPYLRCGRILYVDNYYTSTSLFYDLALAGTGATGTARRRKFMPPNVTDIKFKRRGEKKVMHSGDLVCAQVLDRTPVMLLSTAHIYHGGSFYRKTRRSWTHYHTGRNYRSLQSEHGHGGQLRPDAFIFIFLREKFEMVEKVIFHVFSTAILNSYLVYKNWCSEHQKTPKLQRAIRVRYAKQLISSVRQPPKVEQHIGRPPRTSRRQPCSTHREAFPKEAAGNWAQG